MIPAHIENMSIRSLVLVARNLVDPKTGKPYSLTQIGREVGASPGWADFIIRGNSGSTHQDKKKLRRSSSFLPKMKRWLADYEVKYPETKALFSAVEEHDPTITRHGPHTPMPSPERVVPLTQINPDSDVQMLRQVEVEPPRGIINRLYEREELKDTKAPEDSWAEWHANYQTLRARMWTCAIDCDNFINSTPPIFRPGVVAVRDELMALLDKLTRTA